MSSVVFTTQNEENFQKVVKNTILCKMLFPELGDGSLGITSIFYWTFEIGCGMITKMIGKGVLL